MSTPGPVAIEEKAAVGFATGASHLLTSVYVPEVGPEATVGIHLGRPTVSKGNPHLRGFVLWIWVPRPEDDLGSSHLCFSLSPP